MRDLTRLAPSLDRTALCCRAIIETPRASRYKFDYDPETDLFELGGVLPGSMAFPFAFGFVPGTKAEDGDPLDILVLAEEPLPTGTLLTARLLGIIEACQTEDGGTARNDRVVAKVAQSRAYADLEEMAQLGPAFQDELARFFVTYNDLKGKRFEVTGIGDAARACERVAAATV